MRIAIFYWVLNMSIIGGATGLAVLLIRRIRRIPRTVTCLLWIIPLIRLWLPFGFGGKYSLMTLLTRLATKTIVVYEHDGVPDMVATNWIGAASGYFPVVYKTNLLESVFAVASAIWAVVACGALISAAAIYMLTLAELKSARRLRDNIYISDKMLSPAVVGIIRPRIILPEYIPDGELDFVLLHERAHIRRADNLWRVIAVITACLHWFNPLIWLFLKDFFEDMELACDRRVLRVCGKEKKKDYALALLNCEEKKSVFMSAFGGARIRVRIKNILSYKKLSLLSVICFAAFALVVALTLLLNAASA